MCIRDRRESRGDSPFQAAIPVPVTDAADNDAESSPHVASLSVAVNRSDLNLDVDEVMENDAQFSAPVASPTVSINPVSLCPDVYDEDLDEDDEDAILDDVLI